MPLTGGLRGLIILLIDCWYSLLLFVTKYLMMYFTDNVTMLEMLSNS